MPAEVARASGEVDGVRLPKEAYAVTRVLFDPAPRVHIIGHWTYPAGTRKDVFVASTAESVELFVNGRSLGAAAPTDRFLFTFKDVAFEPGEIKAVASSGGRVVATGITRTAGPAVRLELTPITNAGGLRADGSDVALVDVEAVDASGERCPTFQQRVDFELEGPGVWRGGYNSGKINSVNNTFLDLEAGINRVAIRSTRTAGRVLLRARSSGLAAASVAIESHPFEAPGGVSMVMPQVPAVVLPASAPRHPALTPEMSRTGAVSVAAGPAMLGRFIKTMNYTGPSASIVHVETNAAAGRNVYVDRDYPLPALPQALAGADWIQLANLDQGYSAVDLIELEVAGGSAVTIAYDQALAPPAWLTAQFRPLEGTIVVHGRRMRLFSRAVERDASLTLGSNTEAPHPDANMYVVFVNGGSR